MNGLELTSFITAVANAIACEASNDELDLLGNVFSQLGDTLSTIASLRNICENSYTEKNK